MERSALHGLRVVELGQGDAARYCGMLFSDFGATVVQLPDVHAEWQPHGGLTIDYFGRMLDRGKHAASNGANRDSYLATLRQWVRGADVLVDGSAHGGLPAAGLTYEALLQERPSLVIAALSLAGRDGPSAFLDGCELIAAARASDLQMTGIEGRPPTRSVSPKSEIYAGLLAFCGAMAKLRAAHVQGGGVVDVAYADAMLSAMEGRVEHFFESGRVAKRVGNNHVGYGIYPVADGFVALGIAGSDGNWRRFCQISGRSDLAEHPLLREQAVRRQYPELVEGALDEWLQGKTRGEVVALLQKAGLHGAAVLTVPEMVADPQVEAMQFVVEGGDGTRTWRCGGFPIELSETPARGQLHVTDELAEPWPERLVTPPLTVSAATTSPLPLSGLVVLEFGSGIAGPYGTMVLSDLGARVIKVEDPAVADARFLNFCGSRRRNGKTETVMAGSYRERNKASILIDLRVDGSQDVIHQLIASADVVVANVAPGALERYGFGEAQITTRYPHLIYASISGFGSRGPMAGLRGVDLLALAHSGFASLTGFPGDPPTRSGQSYSDYLAGMALAAGVLVALRERDRTGRGQSVRTSLLGMAATTLGGALEEYLETGQNPLRTGEESYRFGYRCAVWEASDGKYVAVDVTSPAALAAFQALRRGGRVRENEGFDLKSELTQFLSEYSAEEAAQRLQESGVPAAVAGDLRLTASIADFWTRGMFLPWHHTDYGALVITGSPLRLDGSPINIRNLAPRPGEHTAQVLRDFTDFDAETVARLRAAGVVVERGEQRTAVGGISRTS
ncbi:MAG: CoA transferase [Dehalococcoidia bacterium]